MFFVNKTYHVWIIWTTVITVCTCGPLSCPQDSCTLPEVKNNSCKDLDTYIKCMKSLSKRCRGDIGYHSAITVTNSEIKRSCSGHDDLFRNNTGDHSQSPTCQLMFNDKIEHKFCGLFGDPHLRTFDGKYQTCRISGAWQVIENSFFGIMVTNEAVLDNTTATAPTKLTVILKAYKPECTQQKLYEAQGDSQLPAIFGDGTSSFGPQSSPTVSLSWRSDAPNSETAIIRLSYISTIITVTRVGKYLSISAKLPEPLAQNFNQEKNELCSTGCPGPEQIDIQEVTINKLDRDRVITLCRNSVGPTGHKLTDQYLDWCVFDMITSNDEEFINASHAAHSDVLFFEPRSLSNRTITVYEFNPILTADACSTHRLNIFFLIIITLYNFL